MALSGFMIGATLVGLTNLEDLTTALPVPKAPFKPYARVLTAASGKTIGRGFPECQWIFSLLSADQRTQLREFCPDASAAVFIRTMTNEEDVYATFSAVMVWEEAEVRDASLRHDRLEFTVRFIKLVAVVE